MVSLCSNAFLEWGPVNESNLLVFFTEGDDLKNENPSKAIEMFEKVVDLETKLGDQVKW